MAKLSIVKGTTSHRSYIFVQDSSVTTGAGKTGLAYNTASLVAYYVQPGGSATAITLATQTATGAYSSGGFVEVDSTNMPGVYRLDIPNAALTGANSVVVMLKGATNMAPVVLEIELTAVDNQDSVRYGMTALPNAAAGANGGLPTGNASGQVAVASLANNAITASAIASDAITAAKIADGAIDAATFAAGAIDAAAIATDAIGSAEISAAAVTKIQSGLSTYAGGDTAGTTTLLSRLTSTRAGLLDNLDAAISTRLATAGYTAPPSAATIAAAIWDYLTSAATTVGSLGKLIVTNLDAAISTRSTYAGADTSGTTTLLSRLTSTRAGNLDNLTGDAYARLGAPVGASISADVAAVQTTATTIAGYVDTEVAAILASVDTEIGTLQTTATAIKAKTDNLPASPAAVGSAMTLAADALDSTALAASAVTEIQSGLMTSAGYTAPPTANQNADALLKRDWTAVSGEASRSVLNALRMMRNKWSVSGSTLTVTKEDDSTTAYTAELTTDNAAAPITGSDPA